MTTCKYAVPCSRVVALALRSLLAKQGRLREHVFGLYTAARQHASTNSNDGGSMAPRLSVCRVCRTLSKQERRDKNMPAGRPATQTTAPDCDSVPIQLRLGHVGVRRPP